MKLILKKDVPELGAEDSVVNVSDGYGRNFLLPRKLAVQATAKELSAAEKRQDEREKALEARRAEFAALAGKLSALEIVITADAGEGGKLFGSVTNQDIAQALQAQAQVEIDKRKIELADPIKTAGEHEATVRIYKEISARLKIKVTAR